MNQHTDVMVQHLADRTEITLVVDEIDNAVDAKDWERCRGYFTDEIYADFTSLAGGSPGNMAADDLVGPGHEPLRRQAQPPYAHQPPSHHRGQQGRGVLHRLRSEHPPQAHWLRSLGGVGQLHSYP